MNETRLILENYQNNRFSREKCIKKLKDNGWSDIEIGYLMKGGDK